MPLITAVCRETGEITRIPEAWLDDPERGKPFARYAPQGPSEPASDSDVAPSPAPAEREPASGPVADEPSGTPAKSKGGK